MNTIKDEVINTMQMKMKTKVQRQIHKMIKAHVLHKGAQSIKGAIVMIKRRLASIAVIL